MYCEVRNLSRIHVISHGHRSIEETHTGLCVLRLQYPTFGVVVNKILTYRDPGNCSSSSVPHVLFSLDIFSGPPRSPLPLGYALE